MQKYVLDWQEYLETAREAAGDGVVLLRNEKQVLPLKAGSRVSVFGRIQFHYYKSGTGSGGMVNTSHTTGILDALLEEKDLAVNQALADIYREWEETHPFIVGEGWGMELWSQEEMPVSEEICRLAAAGSDAAVVIIGRTAGEDRDNQDRKGAYRLSDAEEQLLKNVRASFDKMIVLLNVGNIIDMSFVPVYEPDAVLYVWQAGMVGGYGVADILTGRKSPSGKLTDTIAVHISDYPSDSNFGSETEDVYAEDIYVGYRYFETMKQESVMYPFGYGLSYTNFEVQTEAAEADLEKKSAAVRVLVKNTGDHAGKEVVQVYMQCPCGKLGKAYRVLAGFEKTKELLPGEEQRLEIRIPFAEFASFDDRGVTGHKSCFVLEEGTYRIAVGTDVRGAVETGKFELEETIETERLSEALAPAKAFERMSWQAAEEMKWTTSAAVSPDEKRLKHLPEEIPVTGDKGIKLQNVKDRRASIRDFVAQFSDDDLCCIVRGEGMGSPKVRPGTAAAFGGVSKSLAKFGIPCACCDDGPSGMRLDSGDEAFSLPNGTLLACTFDRDLNRRLFSLLGREMVKNQIECLLGPGMNLHRHPLNGRNFEYFSEDPYLTGEIGIAQLQGLQEAGVTGTIKHFCGNNQETARHSLDSVISERALRELYLKGFEMAVKSGTLGSIMTTYGKVNGRHTASSYDLTTTILRDEWGYDGIVMTDWWAEMNDAEHPEGTKHNFAAMVRAQNDLYMVCPDGGMNTHGDNTMQALEDGTLTRAELQRCAENICRFLIHTHAMNRLNGDAPEVELLHAPETLTDNVSQDVEYQTVGKELVIPLEDVCTDRGEDFYFGLNLDLGGYIFELTAKSSLGELAQIPVSMFFTSLLFCTPTWNGTNGQWLTKRFRFVATNQNSLFHIHFGQSGLKLKELKIIYDKPAAEIPDWDEYVGLID